MIADLLIKSTYVFQVKWKYYKFKSKLLWNFILSLV